MTADKTVTAAALQWDVQRGELEANLSEMRSLCTEAHALGVRLAVLPEMWGTSFCGDDAEQHRDNVARAESELRELSGDLGLIVCGSNYEFASDGSVFNRASLYSSGELAGEYRKIHLFSPHGEDRYFAAGSDPLVVETEIGRIAVVTCYDLRFPELLRHAFLAEADILLVPAQWPSARELHWRVLCQARAIEEQCFVLATNRCGVEASLVNDEIDVAYPGNSMIVEPTGAILAEGNGERGVFAAELALRESAIMRRALPIAKDRRPESYARFSPGLADLLE